jgi:hypothetical protein
MPRPVTYIPFLTNQEIRDLACGSKSEFYRIYNQVHRVHTKSFSDSIKAAQKKYREKKKLEDPTYTEKHRKAQNNYYIRVKEDPEKKEKLRLYHQKRYQQKKLEKLEKVGVIESILP